MNENETLFKNAPVHKAVFQMAIPTVISSLVLIIYKKKQSLHPLSAAMLP